MIKGSFHKDLYYNQAGFHFSCLVGLLVASLLQDFWWEEVIDGLLGFKRATASLKIIMEPKNHPFVPNRHYCVSCLFSRVTSTIQQQAGLASYAGSH